jgi:hypothetical protein
MDAVVPVAMKLFAVTDPAMMAEDDAKSWSLIQTGMVVVGVRVCTP